MNNGADGQDTDDASDDSVEDEEAVFNRPTTSKSSKKGVKLESNEDPMEREKQRQYTQGFFDALRVVQSTNKFEFNNVTSPILPLIAPTTLSPITPATTSDMATIVMSILGTPGTIPMASPTNLNEIPMDEFSKFLAQSQQVNSAFPGPSMTTSISPPDHHQDHHTNQLHHQQHQPHQQQPPIHTLPVLSNLVTNSHNASTSRPDKLNMTPPKILLERPMSDESDDSGTTSKNGLNMDAQERKKLDRKRARNREAASKCRQKKMDRIKELEEQVAMEKHRGARLDLELDQLKSTWEQFRQAVNRHSTNGCVHSNIRV